MYGPMPKFTQVDGGQLPNGVVRKFSAKLQPIMENTYWTWEYYFLTGQIPLGKNNRVPRYKTLVGEAVQPKTGHESDEVSRPA